MYLVKFPMIINWDVANTNKSTYSEIKPKKGDSLRFFTLITQFPVSIIMSRTFYNGFTKYFTGTVKYYVSARVNIIRKSVVTGSTSKL